MKATNIITSTTNKHIKNLALLQKKAKAREEQGLFVVEGIKLFSEARLAGRLVKAYVSESFYEEKTAAGSDIFEDLDFEIISDALFKSVSDTITPQGIMGTVVIPSCKLEHLIEDKAACLLLLEDIRDPGNLGTIIRASEGAGISGIIMNDTCVDHYSPKVVRSTMGSILRMPLYSAQDFIGTLKEVKKQGITIYAAHLSGKDYDTDGYFMNSCAFLIGNEANGLSKDASVMADQLIKIPMEGRVESLNAAVAAAILMYEAARQRRHKRISGII